jgi:hypothetical protein
MVVKKIINDRQRARKTYGFVRRLPDPVSFGVASAESDIAVLNLDWKESVRFASTGSVTIPPGDPTRAIDGAMNTLEDGDRILLKDQSTGSENGIYIVNFAANDWLRSDDAIPGDTLTCGATTYVEEGVFNEGYKWLLATKTVTLGGSQMWVLFDRGNDWIVSGSGGQMKTQDSIAIGEDFTANIAPDIFFYVSGSRAALGATGASAARSVFAGDMVVSGSINMVQSDGFFGDMLEVSGSVKITTGSLRFQKAGTNDYYYFINSNDGTSFQSGSFYLSGTMAQGYGSIAMAPGSMATGLFSKTQRFGEYSQASSGFATNYTNNSLGKTQYSRAVWCGEAANGAAALLFKGYDNDGNLTQFFPLEDDKTYSVRATATVSDTGDQSDSATFVREALFYKTGGVVTRVSINSTLSMPSANTYDLDVVVSGSTMPYKSDIVFHIDPVSPSTFSVIGDLRGTVTIELTEIQVT